MSLPALALDTNKIPELLPPLTEIPPTFWEAHGWTVVISSGIAVIVLVPLIRVVLRRLAPQPIPPATLARQALEALRGRPDDAATASEVARQLRRFTQATLKLPSGELTTEELLSALRFQPSPSPELRDSLARLLRDCDALHFAPVTPAVGPGFASRALEIVRQIEAQLQKASSQSAVVSESAGNQRQ